MKLGDIPVATMLVASTLVILLAMFGAAAWIQRSSNLAMLEAMDRIERHEVALITLATRWRGLTETNLQRLLASALSKEPVMAQTFGPRLKEGIAAISKLQEELASKATSDEDKAALARISEARTPVLASTTSRCSGRGCR